MKKHLFICLSSTFIILSFQKIFAQEKTASNEKVLVQKGEHKSMLMNADQIYEQRWNMLPQPIFWREIMNLSSDSCLINVASSRKILKRMSWKDWAKQTETQKTLFKDSIKLANNVPAYELIYVTTGKNDFYKFNDVYPQLTKGVAAFEKNGVDPWYAQAILLIESPGQLKKSSAGAYGAFQLMPSVARKYGLIVNSQVDERANFDRCAYGAACIIGKVCIPEARNILTSKNILFNENDLWFRLFVLHIYHAGSMNVRAVVDKINPSNGNQELITKMWQNSAAGFGNNSQNYTQLALASQIILNDMLYEQCDDINHCPNNN